MAPGSHPLKLAVLRHKTRLNAEFTKTRVKRGYATISEFRQNVELGYNSENPSNSNPTKRKLPHPRWVRVNPLSGYSVEDSWEEHPEDWKEVSSLSKVMKGYPGQHPEYYCQDKNIPDLYAFSPHSRISSTEYPITGAIIFQDKASCFPALLLRDAAFEGDVIDACAAPGNKTTHLAALWRFIPRKGSLSEPQSFKNRIHAFERDEARSKTLKEMVERAGAGKYVEIHGNTDFLTVEPNDYRGVTAILLDPSCSGSGIIDRDDEDEHDAFDPVSESEAFKKRKFGEREPRTNKKSLKSRLAGLAAFQLRLILHAMRFPGAIMISYSTCSIHSEENERVVLRALASEVAKKEGWKLFPRNDQYPGLKSWDIRGDVGACKEALDACEEIKSLDADAVADACIRCEKGTQEGTMGFFVAAFIRPFTDPEREAAFQRTLEENRNSYFRHDGIERNSDVDSVSNASSGEEDKNGDQEEDDDQ